ncbi:MAG: hypothetical protein Q9220_007005 [cf. Caloplaca sp. 1 TL-2023]
MTASKANGRQVSGSSNGGDRTRTTPGEQGQDGPQKQKKTAFHMRLWTHLGLNVGMLEMMFKGALAPTIAIAIYQSTDFAERYSTLGYLVAVMSILSFPILPRAKFLQTMLINVIGVCIGSCIALLSIYCSVQARAHTTPPISTGPQSSSGGPSPGASVAPYNSSASAVCAIWLFFNIYFANTLRASRPQLQFPVIMYSIFANVASTYAPQFATMAQGISFTRRLLEAFLTGFAIATSVSFLIFPLTSRTVVFRSTTGYVGALRGAMKAQSRYLQSLENTDAFNALIKDEGKNEDASMKRHQSHSKQANSHRPSAEAQALKTAVATLGELHGKITGDLAFAKREVAYGNLDASEMSELIKLMRQVMLPIIGMSSIADIFDRIAKRRGWNNSAKDDTDPSDRSQETKDHEKSQWADIMKTQHSPFDTLTQVMDQGLQHILLTLGLEKQLELSKKAEQSSSSDLEAKGDVVEPGSKDFAKFLSKSMEDFYEQRNLTLDTWCRQKGIDTAVTHAQASYEPGGDSDGLLSDEHQRTQRSLYLILYVSGSPFLGQLPVL